MTLMGNWFHLEKQFFFPFCFFTLARSCSRKSAFVKLSLEAKDAAQGEDAKLIKMK
jgi:hypothetical protein